MTFLTHEKMFVPIKIIKYSVLLFWMKISKKDYYFGCKTIKVNFSRTIEEFKATLFAKQKSLSSIEHCQEPIFLCIPLLKRLYSFCLCLSCFAGGGHQGPRSMWAPSIWPPMMQSIMSSVNCGNRRIVHIAHFRSCLILNWKIWQPKLTNSWCKCFIRLRYSYGYSGCKDQRFYAFVDIVTMQAQNHS